MSAFFGPAEVRGRLEQIRNILQPVLLAIFIFLPWVKLNNEPYFLFDIFNRHFILFGQRFYSHDAPLLFFVLILVILSIFIVTAIWGRLWCGWACPQTVFIHAVYNKIEKLILGNYGKRVLFHNTDSDGISKKLKLLLVYFVFLVVSWVLAHSFVAYFLGAEVVTRYILEGPQEHLSSFILLTIMTGVLFFNFGFFRENFCFLVCPYGRFQNALIDNNSLTVFYDTVRGEPRGKIRKENVSDLGDCIDCKMCVRACPTKIDIRNGFQMECIACGKCIDACDEAMTKVNRQPNLIRYETGNKKKINFFRFRLFLYGILFVVFFSGFIWLLSNRNPVDFNLARNSDKPFSVRLEREQKIYNNQFYVHLKNNSNQSYNISLSMSERDLKNGFTLSSPAVRMSLAANQDLKLPLFIENADGEHLKNHQIVDIIVHVLLEAELNETNVELHTIKYKKSIEFIRVE